MTVAREKRLFTRFTLDIPASIFLYQTEAYHTGSISNISLAGCFVPLDIELPVGEPCRVNIIVGEGLKTEQVTLPGRIVRTDAEGVGITFTDTSIETKQQLEKILFRIETKG